MEEGSQSTRTHHAPRTRIQRQSDQGLDFQPQKLDFQSNGAMRSSVAAQCRLCRHYSADTAKGLPVINIESFTTPSEGAAQDLRQQRAVAAQVCGKDTVAESGRE